MREFHTIVEFSYNQRKKSFMVRFLDGTCIKVLIDNLAAKYQSTAADWDSAEMAKDKESLNVPAGKKKINIPAHALYAAGRIV